MTREEAIKAIDHIMYSSPHESTEEVVKKQYYAEKLIDYIVNTIEVVRCKDCKHYLPNSEGEGRGECLHAMYELFPTPTDYCSMGEKIDEVTE